MADCFDTRKPHVCECGDHAWLALTKGYVTLIDPEDICLITASHHMAPSKGKPYARSSYREYLHRRLVDCGNSPVDHANGDSLDNRKRNLRVCTYSQNLMNMSAYDGRTSRFKGVSRHGDKWRATIKVAALSSRRIWLGRFESESEAAQAYDEAAIKHFGQFAKTNSGMGLL